ncbi:MAG: glycoside hydrolase family 3 protein [Actinomycetota bacterium]|nr:MAG: glycoside hydrolase family 3 protein [Actinomycetota bacterium]
MNFRHYRTRAVGFVAIFSVSATVLAGCSGFQSSVTASRRLTPKPVALPPVKASTSVPALVPKQATSSPCSSSIDIGKWSSDRMAAQMLAVSANGGALSNISQAVRYGVGGVVLMGNSSSSSLGTAIANLKQTALGDVAPIFMADEEGGGIQGLSALVSSMPWPRSMARTMTISQVEDLSYRVGQGMRSLGVDMDLAPVVDLDAGPGPSMTNPDGSRSFSADPTITVQYARAFVAGLEKAGITAVIKHFPGLGGAASNTDFAAAATLPYSRLVVTGMIPFKQLATDVKAVMISNASVPGLTGATPASLSPRAVSILRNVVGFNGMIISDSLETVSISSYQADLSKAAVESAEAGVDMVMLASSNPNQMANFLAARLALSQAIGSVAFPRSAAEASVGRILALKGFPPSCIYY